MSHRQKIIFIFVLIFGSIIFSLPLLKSGLTYSYGLGFWGPSGHDMVWHLQLINHINSVNNLTIPSFSGVSLQNYHPFYDLLIATIHLITKIPNDLLVFQIFPIITSLIFLTLSFSIGFLLTKKYHGGILLMVLSFLTGSFGWIITLFQSGKFAGESLFWSMQPPSFQTNPPLILSLIFLQIVVIHIIKNKNNLFTIISLSLLPITKVYGGVAGFIIWGLYSLFQIKQKNYRPLLILFASLLIASLLFFQYNSTASSLIQLSPFWFVSQLFSSTDKLFIPKVSSAISTYTQTFNLKLIPLLAIGTIIFIVGNMGWRILGYLKVFKENNIILKLIAITALIFAFIPLFVVQKGTPWNTIQFFYYTIFFSNILLTNYLISISSKNTFLILTAIIILTSVLGNIDTYHGFLGNPAPSSIPTSEITALHFLNSQPQGIVLTFPFDDHIKDSIIQTPIPLYAYVTSGYISAYTNQLEYLADEMNLNNSGYNWQSKRQESVIFFNQKNIFQDRGFLVNNKIDYIYLTGLQKNKTNLDVQNMYLSQIYNDQNTIIYKVNR